MDCSLDSDALPIEALMLKSLAKFVFRAGSSKMGVVGAAVMQCWNDLINGPMLYRVG